MMKPDDDADGFEETHADATDAAIKAKAARPESIEKRVLSLLRGSDSWRQGTESNLGAKADRGLANESFMSNLEDGVWDTNEPDGYDTDESIEDVFEAIDGIYRPPMTLEEHEDYCNNVLHLDKEIKSSWDELFFDLALVAAFGSLAGVLALSAELDDAHADDHAYADDHAADHRLLSSGVTTTARMPFPRAVFLYCLETATVISVRRFTDGHRAQWRRNDLFGSLLLLGRAICCLGMGGTAPHGDDAVWKFHAWNTLANGLGLWSIADSFLSRPVHWRTLRTEAVNLAANALVSLLFVFVLHPKMGNVGVGWLGYALWALYLPFMYCGSWMLPHSGIGPHTSSKLRVNVEYVSERFGLLVIITCGESLFAAVAILQQGDSAKKMVVAFLSVYYALLIKLLYFELQSCVAKHAMQVNTLRGILWTLAHLPLYVSAAGAGAVLHWAAVGHKWLIRERNLFLGFTVVSLLALSFIALMHGKLHNDRGVWWTNKKARVSVRLLMCAVIIVGCSWRKRDRENVWTILYVCALVTLDFMYEFNAKRAIFEEHQIEEHEHEVARAKRKHIKKAKAKLVAARRLGGLARRVKAPSSSVD